MRATPGKLERGETQYVTEGTVVEDYFDSTRFLQYYDKGNPANFEQIILVDTFVSGQVWAIEPLFLEKSAGVDNERPLPCVIEPVDNVNATPHGQTKKRDSRSDPNISTSRFEESLEPAVLDDFICEQDECAVNLIEPEITIGDGCNYHKESCLAKPSFHLKSKMPCLRDIV